MEHGQIERTTIGQLQRGDYLVGSGVTVIVPPTAGVRTPGGKVDLEVRWPSGQEKWHTWGKHTKVNVVRANPAKVYRNGPIPTRDVAGEWDRRAEEE